MGIIPKKSRNFWTTSLKFRLNMKCKKLWGKRQRYQWTCSTHWPQCLQTSPYCSPSSTQSLASEMQNRRFMTMCLHANYNLMQNELYVIQTINTSKIYVHINTFQYFVFTIRGSRAGRPRSGTPALYLLPMFTTILKYLYLYI